MTGNAPVHPRLTPRKTPSSDIDLIQSFIAKNGVTKPTTAQEGRYARKEQRDRGSLTASDPSAYRFRPGTEAYSRRSAMMSEGFTLDHKPLLLEKLTGEYAEEPAPKSAPPVPAAPPPIMGQCAHCQKPLPRRARTDALYCSDAHKMAAHRKRKLREKADRSFKVELQIARNTDDADRLLREYDWLASFMNWEARANGIEATFFGTPRGALIIEDTPGAAMLTVSTRSAWEVDRHCWSHRERQPRSLTEHSSRDPMMVEMADAP